MSHVIVAIDISRRSVKVLKAAGRLRSHEVIAYREVLLADALATTSQAAQAVPPALPSDAGTGAESADDAAAPTEATGARVAVDPGDPLAGLRAALALLADDGMLSGDLVVASYRLGECMQTVVRLPFSDRKRVDPILPAALDEAFPAEIEDLVYDYTTRSAGPGSPEHILTVIATPHERMASFLAMLAEVGIDPRMVDVRPAALMTAARYLEPAAAAIAESGEDDDSAALEAGLATGASATPTVAVVDLGGSDTEVCFYGGESLLSLRQLRFGVDQLIAAIGVSFDVDPARALGALQRQGAVHPHANDAGGGAPEGSDQARFYALCHDYARRLARELGRTFHGVIGQGAEPVSRVLLCGGGARLKGLAQFLELSLGVPVTVLDVSGVPGLSAEAGPEAATTVGLMARGLGLASGSQLDMRRGQHAFRGDFEFLKARSRGLLVAAAFFAAALLFLFVANKQAVDARHQAYSDALCQATEAVFQECIRDPGLAMARLGPADGDSIIPDVTAFEIFRDIGGAIVYLRDGEEIPVELSRLRIDVQQDVIAVQGDTSTAGEVDVIVDELAALRCLEAVQPENVRRNQATGLFTFEIRARNSCR